MRNFITYILQDWQANSDTSSKSRFILLMFRLSQILSRLPAPFSFLSTFSRVFYQLIVEWLLGVELPWDTQVGTNLKLIHAVALVVNHNTIIGKNCTLRHSTTIGNKKLPNGSYSGCPEIGNNVDIGSNVVIIGSLTIGDNALIGAGSVVVKDVPSGTVVAGNPAKVIRTVNTNSKTSDSLEKVDCLEPTSVSG